MAAHRAGPSWRYRKDILRQGHWHAAGRPLRITTSLLQRLVANFHWAWQRGVYFPVVWNHSLDARDRIGTLTRLWQEGPVLFAEFTAPAWNDRRKLGLTAPEVSVALASSWHDGLGHVYDVLVSHLAVVNHPVVAGQGPFVVVPPWLSSSWSLPLSSQGAYMDSPSPGTPASSAVFSGAEPFGKPEPVTLAAASPTAAGKPNAIPPRCCSNLSSRGSGPFLFSRQGVSPAPITPSEEGAEADPPAAGWPAVLQALNALLGAVGSIVFLPPDTTLANLPARLADLTQLLAEPAADRANPNYPNQPNQLDPEPQSPPVASLGLVPPTSSRSPTAPADWLFGQLAGWRREQTDRLRATFTTTLKQLTAQGRVHPADHAALLQAGAAAGFALSLLEPFARLPAGGSFPVAPKARVAATAEPPTVGRLPLTDQRLAEITAAYST